MNFPEIEGFEIIGKIGEGGMAVVWKARQISLDRIVAIKILSSEIKDDSSDAERFQSEARSAAKLKHPGIVQVHDAGSSKDRCYFVMEYVAGYTVGDWIRRKKRLSEDESLVVAECVAAALNYAWTTAGMIHCDIKPDNVIIDDDGTVKVADLGLARTMSSIVSESLDDEVMGTPAYISPEQAQGMPDLDCRSDIYSLGAMLYHMVTGKLMFQGHDEEEVMELQITTDPVDPRALNPDLSEKMYHLIMAMLAKDPALRPQTWAEVIETLVQVRKALHAGPSGAEGEGAHPTRRIVVNHDRLARLAASGSAPYKKESGGAGAMLWLGLAAIIAVLAYLLYCQVTRRSSSGSGMANGGRQPPVQVIRIREEDDEPGPDHDASAAGSPVRNPAVSAAGAVAAEPGGTNAAAAEGAAEEDPGREMLDLARKWSREHPDEPREALRMFARVADDTRGTKYALMAEEEILRLEKSLRNTKTTVMEDLKARARALEESGDLLGAARVLDEYSGPAAVETRRERMGEAEALRKQHRQARIEDGFARRRSERRIKGSLEDLAERLLSEGVDAGLAFADGLVHDPVLVPNRSELETISGILQGASTMGRRILESFNAQKGMEITVDMVQGPQTYSIVGVRGDQVVGCTILRIGAGTAKSEVTFGLSDLSIRERLARMGSDTEPEVALAKGLMAFNAKSYEHARRYFGMVGTDLSRALVQCVDSRQNRL